MGNPKTDEKCSKCGAEIATGWLELPGSGIIGLCDGCQFKFSNFLDEINSSPDRKTKAMKARKSCKECRGRGWDTRWVADKMEFRLCDQCWPKMNRKERERAKDALQEHIRGARNPKEGEK